MILKPWSSRSHFWLSMHSMIAFPFTAPTVAQKYPRTHTYCPQYRFRKWKNSSFNRCDDRPLEILPQIRRRQLRRCSQQHLHMIRRDHPSDNAHFPRLLRYFPAQNVVPVLRDPDQMVLDVLFYGPLNRYSSIPPLPRSNLEAKTYHLKGCGIKPGTSN